MQRKKSGTRAYILLELGELLAIIILLVVISRFIHVPLWIAIAIPVGKFLKFIIVYPLVRRSVRQPIYSGMESLIGERGLATETLNPQGYIKLRGELWKAVSNEGPIPSGTQVEVCRLERTRLVVKRVG